MLYIELKAERERQKAMAQREREQCDLRLLASVDRDRATLLNARGFSKCDSKRGHKLAETPIEMWNWHDDLWAGGCCYRYFNQLQALRKGADVGI